MLISALGVFGLFLWHNAEIANRWWAAVGPLAGYVLRVVMEGGNGQVQKLD